MVKKYVDEDALRTIFHECRQCGTCCKKYRKIVLQPGEIDFVKKMGGHVGVTVSMSAICEKGLDTATTEAKSQGKVYMIHPDEKGCVFLEHRNDKYYCKLYNYRPKTCRGFRCNLADDSFLQLFGGDNAIHLLGQDTYGLFAIEVSLQYLKGVLKRVPLKRGYCKESRFSSRLPG